MPFIKGQSGNPKGKPAGAKNKWTDELKAKALKYGVDALTVAHGILMDTEQSTKDRLKAAEVILKPASVHLSDGTPNTGITVNLGFIAAGQAPHQLQEPIDAHVQVLPQVLRLTEPVSVASDD
jgi:hypothetical protein